MSVELDAWTAFKTASSNSATLAAYAKTFIYGRKPFIFSPAEHPVFMAWPHRIPEDNYFTFPKRKMVKLEIVICGIIKNSDVNTREDEILKYDAIIKNAIENDITLGGKAIITNLGSTSLAGIMNEDTVVLQIPAIITLPILTAGNR